MIKQLQIKTNKSKHYVIYRINMLKLEVTSVYQFDVLDDAINETKRLIEHEGVIDCTYGIIGRKVWDKL